MLIFQLELTTETKIHRHTYTQHKLFLHQVISHANDFNDPAITLQTQTPFYGDYS